MSQRRPQRFYVFVALFLVSGCASVPTPVTVRAHSPCPCETAQALVLVADGAGDFRAASSYFAETVDETHAPLCVQPVIWSHGYGRIIADQMDGDHLRSEGKRLAELILTHRQQHPEMPIYLVGHSAGSGVVMYAVDWLPPAAVERIVLLAPAVSAHHDLKAALTAARQGVDVFYSRSDWWYLGMGVSMLGTADRHWDPAAGRVGFQPLNWCPEDGPLYEKLRQHPWQECLSWTGNKGGHYGAYQPGFLKVCVLPLLDVPRERP